MKSVSITALLLLAISTASAQVASHAPATATTKAPEQSSPSLHVTGKPVARVNGVALSDQDLLREMYIIFPYARVHNGFPKEQEAEIRKGALDMIIFEELVYQDAEHRKMTVPPAKLDRSMAAFRARFASPAEYKQFLQVEFKGSRQALRQRIWRSLLIEALLKSDVQSKAVVSTLQAKAFYDKNPKNFEIPESYSIQTISILPKDASAEQAKDAHKRADDALRLAKETKSYEQFGLLAEKVSQDDFRVDMGMHKPALRAELPPSVLQALGAMQPGQVTNVIQLAQAYAIVRYDSHSSAGKRKFAAVKDGLRKDMEKKKNSQLRSDLGKRLRKNANVELL